MFLFLAARFRESFINLPEAKIVTEYQGAGNQFFAGCGESGDCLQ